MDSKSKAKFRAKAAENLKQRLLETLSSKTDNLPNSKFIPSVQLSSI